MFIFLFSFVQSIKVLDTIPEHYEYNQLGDFDELKEDGFFAKYNDVIPELSPLLSDVLTRHGFYGEKLALQVMLLHKHVDLEPGEVMVSHNEFSEVEVIDDDDDETENRELIRLMSPKNATDLFEEISPKLLMFKDGNLVPMEFIKTSVDPAVARQFKLLQENEGLVDDLHEVLLKFDAVNDMGFSLCGKETGSTWETSGKVERYHMIYSKQTIDSDLPELPGRAEGGQGDGKIPESPEGNCKDIDTDLPGRANGDITCPDFLEKKNGTNEIFCNRHQQCGSCTHTCSSHCKGHKKREAETTDNEIFCTGHRSCKGHVECKTCTHECEKHVRCKSHCSSHEKKEKAGTTDNEIFCTGHKSCSGHVQCGKCSHKCKGHVDCDSHCQGHKKKEEPTTVGFRIATQPEIAAQSEC